MLHREAGTASRGTTQWLWQRLAAIVIVLLTLILPAHALDFPPLTGRVVDEAHVLDRAQIEELTGKLAALEAKTTDQLVVATVSSLRGTSVEDYANRLFREWKLGQKDKNNGVLLLVAPTERKVRIEVGYGLEGTLTDAISKFIIETSIVPRFRSNDVPGGIRRGVDDVILVLTGAAPEWKQLAATRRPSSAPVDELPWPLIVTIIVILLIIFHVVSFVREIRRAQRGGGRRGDSLEPSWGSSSGSSGSSSSDFGGGGGGGGGSDFSGGGGSSGGGGASGSW
jgi:uncharacterized protein